MKKEGQKGKKIEIVTKGVITESEMKLLIAKNGYPIVIEVEMDDYIATGYFKKPSLQIFSIVMKYVSVSGNDGDVNVKDYEKFTNTIIQNCWLAGDENIKNDEMAAFPTALRLFALFKPKVARVKKR